MIYRFELQDLVQLSPQQTEIIADAVEDKVTELIKKQFPEPKNTHYNYSVIVQIDINP